MSSSLRRRTDVAAAVADAGRELLERDDVRLECLLPVALALREL